MVEMRLRKTVERLQLIARGEYLSNEIEAEQQESDNMESTKLTKEDDKSSSPEEDVDPEETVFEEKQSPEVEDI
jgi:hypothetical protein